MEGISKGKWFGRTRTNKLVFISSAANLQGRLVDAEIVSAGPWSLQGRVDEGVTSVLYLDLHQPALVEEAHTPVLVGIDR